MTILQLLQGNASLHSPSLQRVLLEKAPQRFLLRLHLCNLVTLRRNLIQGSSKTRRSSYLIWDNAKRNSKLHTTVANMEEIQLSAPAKRCALITGVAKPFGIGRTLLHQFIKQGYWVVGADLKEMEYADKSPGRPSDLSSESFHFVRADISDPFQAKLIVEQGVQWFGGRIHVLINNAGRTNPVLSGADRIKEFTDTITVNLNGAYYMSECVLPYMVYGQSSIIHISSTRALQSEPHTEGYSASKAGICGLTHAQAITLAGKVRVNAVLPGWINTDPSGEQLRPVDHAWHPAGRIGEPNDVAHLCLFLCDNERAGFITGQEFVLDGGMTKKMIYPDD